MFAELLLFVPLMLCIIGVMYSLVLIYNTKSLSSDDEFEKELFKNQLSKELTYRISEKKQRRKVHLQLLQEIYDKKHV